MGRLDIKLSSFVRSIKNDDIRTSVEATIDGASEGFGSGLKGSAFSTRYLVEPPKQADVEAAVRMVNFHAHRLGLSISHLRMLMEMSWENPANQNPNRRDISRSVRTLPKISNGIRRTGRKR